MKRNTIFCLLLISHWLFSEPGLPKIPFIKAMEPNKAFRPRVLLIDGEWGLINALYEKYVLHGTYHEKPLIPKIIHHIWLGGPLPEKYRKFRESWMEFHPDWEFRLWTDSDIESFNLKNRRQYDAMKNYGAKSDIARYEILYCIGGLYVDTDFECLHSFDELHHYLNFYTGLGFEGSVRLYNGLIASAPGHPILKHCIDSLPKITPKHENANTVMDTTGPTHFTRSFFRVISTLPGEPVVVFPTTYFYPWPHFLRKDPNPYRWIRAESLALHHWAVSWLEK